MSFRRRLLLIMLGVVIVAQLVTAVATLGAIRRDELIRGGRELAVGLDVTRQLLRERGRQLRDNVAILAADYGFRSAVATRDTATLASVLANHGERAGADMVILTDPRGSIMAGTHLAPGSALPFESLWQQAQQHGQAVGVVLQDGQPFQFVLLPVRAPNLIGWIGMGFVLDDSLAREIGQLTRLSVSFVVGTAAPQHGDEFVSGALAAGEGAGIGELRQGLARGRYLEQSRFEPGSAQLTRATLLVDGADGRVYTVVQRSRSELLAMFYNLGWQMLVIFLLTLVLIAVAVALCVRSMARPLVRLADAARRIGRGERLQDMPVRERGEVGLLARTLAGMQQDLDERERSLLHQTRHDQLTDLANRSCAQQDIEAAVHQGRPFTLLRLAISGFRHINDTFGYDMGDRVLVTLARRLRALPPPLRQAYRIGGDEFLLLLDVAQAEKVWLTGLLDELFRPIDPQGTPIRPTLSLGEVNFPAHGHDTWLLLRRAEIAMAVAHRTHCPHRRYEEGQDEQHQRQLKLVRDLQQAVTDHQLFMVYQPQTAAPTGCLTGFEALMRWQHPELGFIPPDEFISLAEQSGHMTLLSQWMIETVCRQLAEWNTQGHRLRVAINLSARDVVDPTLADRLEQVLLAHDVAADQLTLEVTESAIIQDPVMAVTVLERLRRAGVRIAIDDYGTGYSSLSQLRTLPVRELKIDKSFVLGLEEREEDRIIVRSTIELGHNLGLEVVAEGVETEAARQLLANLGCNYLQGYLISRPLPAQAVPGWIADGAVLERHP
ncbi:diguanylate cyclase/phosphodiesterase [Kushneria sinocarnis]|uniref:cyclic-guanylate-specific phosphodiesterase n=1 Tax=Kushneria sinocarnis TaxID=595502 RepID=A0A420X1D9_9GAMM|nr:EAL domain-containing protein [Kushneria sinocarnis]RKR07676.1 diguanylate cyclase/phosphodiesterase [Kushneria sinocarnis]